MRGHQRDNAFDKSKRVVHGFRFYMEGGKGELSTLLVVVLWGPPNVDGVLETIAAACCRKQTTVSFSVHVHDVCIMCYVNICYVHCSQNIFHVVLLSESLTAGSRSQE